MNKRIILLIFSGLTIILLSGAAVIHAAGEYAYTGSPIDGGATHNGQCSGCHSGGATVPTLSISSSPAFGGSGTALTYSAGTTYTITVTAIGSYPKWGMNCEVINSQATSGVGDFGTFGTAVSSNCKIYPPSSPYPTCASHKVSSTTPWSFIWTAPATGTGFLYADVLGANGDGNTGGDKVSAPFCYTLTPASGAGIETYKNTEINLSVFPNPATDKVNLSYTLKEKGTVSIKLYTLNGDFAADLLNETQEVGMQKTTINLPVALAKGLYLIRFNVNGNLTTQKLMIR